MRPTDGTDKSLEAWIWDAACSIRGAKDASKYKDFILPLIFTKRLCDVFDDEINRIAIGVGSREKAFALVKHDKQLIRYYIPFEPANPNDPVWSVIRTLSSRIGEQLTSYLRAIADENPRLRGIIDRVDFNATTHGQRDLADDRLSDLIERISEKRLGLKDVEPDVIGRSYEYLIRKFAENSGQSAGEFFTPTEVGFIIARIVDAQPGMEVYDPCCGSAGLLIKCAIVAEEKREPRGSIGDAPLQLYGQEYIPETWAMANMNMIIHDMEGDIEIGDTMRTPKFIDGPVLKQFDRVVANPMWNQPGFSQDLYMNDPYERFFAGIAPQGNADWAWIQHCFSSLKDEGVAAVVLDTTSLSRGSNTSTENREKIIRKKLVDQGCISSVVLLPENLFYNTGAPGVLIFLTKEPVDDVLLVNASREFAKGKPKNVIPEENARRIVDVVGSRTEVDGFSVLLSIETISDIDYDLSPQRHIPIDPEIAALGAEELDKGILCLRDEAQDLAGKRHLFLKALNDAIQDGVEWTEMSIESVISEEVSGDWGEELPQGADWIKCAVIRGTDFPRIRQGKTASCPYRFVRESRYQRKRPKAGDIIVEISGGGKYQNTGRVVLFSHDLEESLPPLLFSNFTKLLRPNAELVDPGYLFHYWDLLYELGRTAKYEKQPTSIKNFKLKDFLASEVIRFPRSIELQRHMSSILSVVSEEIRNADVMRRDLGGLKLSLALQLLA